MTYYAHKAEDGRLQTVEEHLNNVSELAGKFASSFSASEYGKVVGYFHDIGKCTEAFQKRLLEGGPKVDHSSAGALMLWNNDKTNYLAQISGCHHSGLSNLGSHIDDEDGHTFWSRIARINASIEKGEFSSPDFNVEIPDLLPPEITDKYTISMWERMLFSCLVDADFLDTEEFMNGESIRPTYDNLETLNTKLDNFVSKWKTPTTEIGRIRNEVREDCLKAADSDKSIFSLTVPTGGGKTISSLAFALKHAIKHHKDRIIYVVPYISIIEQTADVFKSIVGAENVVEHYSDADYDEEKLEDSRALLSTENWDAPIILTTSVQFFESLYSSRVSKCRKLHNIANSVVIFDEVQSMPIEHLRPCVGAIGCLSNNFNVTTVLCSATQPYIEDILKEFSSKDFSVTEICHNVQELFDALKRVNYKNDGNVSTEDLGVALSRENQVLCIVNTRKTAKTLYDLISMLGDDCFHLSTLMTPVDKRRVLSIVRDRLKNGLPCKLVSTSLIEAGVDVDFPVVYREFTGMDSIVQAGGRCNREGKRALTDSFVHVFELTDNESRIMPTVQIQIASSQSALKNISDLGSKECVDTYFKEYRTRLRDGVLDSSFTILDSEKLNFETVSNNFHMIPSITKTIHIKCDEIDSALKAIKDGVATRKQRRQVGKYSVNVYANHFEELRDAGDIEVLEDGSGILTNGSLYNHNTGLALHSNFGLAEFV